MASADLSETVIHELLQPGLRLTIKELEALGGDHASASSALYEIFQQSEVKLFAAGVKKGYICESRVGNINNNNKQRHGTCTPKERSSFQDAGTALSQLGGADHWHRPVAANCAQKVDTSGGGDRYQPRRCRQHRVVVCYGRIEPHVWLEEPPQQVGPEALIGFFVLIFFRLLLHTLTDDG